MGFGIVIREGKIREQIILTQSQCRIRKSSRVSEEWACVCRWRGGFGGLVNEFSTEMYRITYVTYESEVKLCEEEEEDRTSNSH